MDNEDKTVKYARDKPGDCHYCYFWLGPFKGCVLGGLKQCFYIIPEEDHTGDRCYGCPYGRDTPCIGWCTRDVMDAVLKKKKTKGR